MHKILDDENFLSDRCKRRQKLKPKEERSGAERNSKKPKGEKAVNYHVNVHRARQRAQLKRSISYVNPDDSSNFDSWSYQFERASNKASERASHKASDNQKDDPGLDPAKIFQFNLFKSDYTMKACRLCRFNSVEIVDKRLIQLSVKESLKESLLNHEDISCDHVFHLECIKRHFETYTTCPICNKDKS